MYVLKMVLFGLMFGLCFSSYGEKTIHMTSVEWPPYSGKKLPEQGASIAVARAAFAAMGYELKVDFFPWARTVALANKAGSQYSGYFPEYYSDEIAERFIFSDPMGVGPLGFAQLNIKPISWGSLGELSAYKVGVVRGYVNTPELDALIADGTIKAEPVVADIDNIKKLSVGRIDLAVVDKHVLTHLLSRESILKSARSQVSFNTKLLANKQLFMCFKKTAKGEELAAIYNEGLKRIDIESIMKAYLIQSLEMGK